MDKNIPFKENVQKELLSLTSFSLLFNGETPMLSFFLDFMYFQNGLVLLDFSPFSMVSFIYVHSAFLIEKMV
jgi:hypothetical protein